MYYVMKIPNASFLRSIIQNNYGMRVFLLKALYQHIVAKNRNRDV